MSHDRRPALAVGGWCDIAHVGPSLAVGGLFSPLVRQRPGVLQQRVKRIETRGHRAAVHECIPCNLDRWSRFVVDGKGSW